MGQHASERTADQRAAWPKPQNPKPKPETLNPKPEPQEQCYGDRMGAGGTRNQREAWPDGKFGDYAFAVSLHPKT